MLSAIIVAGGSSQRMGFDKTFASLGGKPAVAHSIAAFEQTDSVGEIILVGRAERLSELEELVRTGKFGKVSAIIPGGARRQDSVRHGLEKADDANDFIAVHDAARPLVSPGLIERILELARAHGGAASAAPVSDTLKRADDERIVTGGVERDHLFAVQTPQIFQAELLRRAYAAIFAAGLEVTDEISAVEQVGGKVALLPNETPNFKLTYPADLRLAEFVLGERKDTR
ncbi:MAG: 2-C-methyl-D-erythritol 4-phosphate cytidylyltransferase [Chthoniobacterales bacterium]